MFCKQLNIVVTLSSGYHHSSNPAEWAGKTQITHEKVSTGKYIMAHCLDYCYTPLGANIPSPSQLLGRQFRGLLPFFQDCSASESVKEQVLLMKEAGKQRFDKMAHDLTYSSQCHSDLHQQGPKNLVHSQGGKLHTKIICGTHRGGQINFLQPCTFTLHQCTFPSKTI